MARLTMYAARHPTPVTSVVMGYALKVGIEDKSPRFVARLPVRL